MTENPSNLHSALFCISMASRIVNKPVSSDRLRQILDVADTPATLHHLARALAEINIRTRPSRKKLNRLKPHHFPAIGRRRDGDFVLLAACDQTTTSIVTEHYSDERQRLQPIKELAEELTGELLLIRGPDSLREKYHAFGLRWFLREAVKYHGVLRDCLLASLFIQVFALLSPLVFMIVIDKVLSNHSLSTLDVLVLALVVVSAFEILLNAFRTYLLSHTASRIDLVLGVKLFRHLMGLPLSYFESRQVGDTIARVKELETVRRFITGAGLMVLLDLAFTAVFLFVMYLFSPFLSCLVLIALPILFTSSMLLTPLLRNNLEDTYVSGAQNQAFLVESITGIGTVKGIAAESRFRENWENQLTHHVKNGFSSGHLSNILNQSSMVISKVLTIALLWFGAREVLVGSITVGQLIAFNMLSSRVIAPVLRLSQFWKEFQQTRVAIARIADIFQNRPEPGYDPDRVELPPVEGEVRFEHVSFSYRPDGPEILTDISFSISPGEIVGIVGSTGSGKSTIAKLLQRLYVPTRGRILVDGFDLSTIDGAWYRNQTGAVMQDNVLFDMSIRDNIAINLPELELKKIREAASLAGADEFIMALPENYDTRVGERGLQLSTGQRQRVAIARALAAQPALLILDEATSALDYQSELKVQANMQTICKGKTVFIIAHRFSTLRNADRILCLEDGHLVEDGHPDQLRKNGGRIVDLMGLRGMQND